MKDQCTLSNYQGFEVQHTKLHFKILFDEKRLLGRVDFKLKSLINSDKLILDTSYLEISSVLLNGKPTGYTQLERIEPYGSPLVIAGLSDEIFEISIEFSTTAKGTAVQFIKGDTGPYIFSQCQAIHARSLFPCFDTPGVKSTYTFSVESPYKCLMSGRPNEELSRDGVYYFDQPIPIPSYLVSITSGNLHEGDIGPRSKVYCELPNLQACKWEFEKDTENFIQIAENLIFDYEWDRFDSLVLPTSFPYGGMEIPNITHLTPTLICGDRSQVKVMAHELAHSWSGNLVTNSSWEHFWLNEGWTVYIERRILENIASKEHGPEYGEQVRQFQSILGWNSLVEAVNLIDPKFTTLVWDLNGVSPDDAFSKIPYEKGFNFIYYLENMVGGKAKFDPFIKHYFTTWRYKALDSEQFKSTFTEFYKDDKQVLESIDWDRWLHGQGLPPVIPKFDTTLADEVYALVNKWIDLTKKDLDTEFDQKEINEFDFNQQLLFLETLITKLEEIPKQKTIDLVSKLRAIYQNFENSKNCEIILLWHTLLIKYGNLNSIQDPVVVRFASWLGTVGRMKFVRPGYGLLDHVVDHEFAIDTFNQYCNSYHPICRTMVRKDLGLDN